MLLKLFWIHEQNEICYQNLTLKFLNVIKKGMASVNMQMIRMINKKSNNNNHNNNQNNNNNNNQSSSGSGKVVTLVPPTSSSTSSKEATSTSKSSSLNAQTLAQPSSPSVSLPALKKRTTIVKQNVPPPVPPRGSPRSKSNLMHRNVNKSVCSGSIVISSPINANHLKVLNTNEKSGCDKVTEWLETIYIPPIPSIPSINNSHTLPLKRNAPRVPEMEIQFKSVKKMIETFSKKDFNSMSTRASSGCVVVGGVSIKCCKISDSSIVQARVGDFNSLQLTQNNNAKTLRSFDTGTDSGIDDSSREQIYPRKINQSFIGWNETMAINYHNLQRVMSQLSLDGEFV